MSGEKNGYLLGVPGHSWHDASLLRNVGAIGSLLVSLLAAWFLHGELAAISWTEVLTNVRSHSLTRVLLAVACATAGYAALTGYDALAVRYVGKSIPYSRTAVTAFMAFAVGHNVGIATLSGGSIRYRMYSTMGFTAGEIAKIIGFCTVTFALASAFMLGMAFLLMPESDLAILRLPGIVVRLLGTFLGISAGAYVLLPLLRHSPVQLGNWRIEIPSLRLTSSQLVLSITDLCFAAGTLYVLVAPELNIGFLSFLGIYLIALAAGLISSIPGGIGVFETVMLVALPEVDREFLLSTIVVYRLVYYIAPLATAMGLLGTHEIRVRSQKLGRAGEVAMDWLSSVTPQVFGVLTFLAGAVLLLSGSMPAVESRLALIARYIPSIVLEMSHLSGSVFGLCLLVLARGLFRRLYGAYRATSGLLLGGIAASLLKGLDYEEAALLAIALLLLWAAQAQFYRRGSLRAQAFSAGWIVSIAVVLIGSFWIGLVSNRHVPYTSELWWQFSLDADAPRMLRATFAVVTVAIGFSLWKLIRPQQATGRTPSLEELNEVRQIVFSASDSSANAALLGDKQFLFSTSRDAFIMYGISGRSWIALGDPVGPQDQLTKLAWQFRELCDRHDAIPAFYQVADDHMSLYVDMGLSLWKLGEEARVPLSEFSLEGSARADLRQARNRMARADAQFQIVTKPRVGAIINELKAVSDAWLSDKSMPEKGFSLGRFSVGYLSNFDCAVVRVKDQIVAFANLWPAPVGSELSIDLMRHNSDAPKGVMDFLFTELILWACAQNYQWFNLGMAPLSGLENHTLAPLWQKLGNLIFRHGEEFYNFEGLRAYKEKFGPIWRPKYLACPSGLTFPRVLLDASVLISRKQRSTELNTLPA